MEPVSAGIIISTALAAATSAMTGVTAASNASAQAKAAEYNATVTRQQGQAAFNSAVANENIQRTRANQALGEEASALSEANIGLGGSAADVMRQSTRQAELDALNIRYGGLLEKRQANAQAELFDYQSKVASANATTSLISGGMGAGTALLRGVGLPALGQYQENKRRAQQGLPPLSFGDALQMYSPYSPTYGQIGVNVH